VAGGLQSREEGGRGEAPQSTGTTPPRELISFEQFG